MSRPTPPVVQILTHIPLESDTPLASLPSQPSRHIIADQDEDESQNQSRNQSQDQSQRTGQNTKACPNPQAHEPHPLFVAFVLITSSLLFLAIFGLQVAGLVKSFHKPSETITASWCSPLFGSFGLSELSLDCIIHDLTPDYHKGIGCLDLPGTRQLTWLMVTKITLLLAICIEGIDALILWFVPLDYDLWIVQVKRPWLTMSFGLIMLVLILVVGTMDAYSLPPGISEKIWLVVDSGANPFICTGHLSPAGLRGQLIGWLDGLLQSWKSTYFGL